MSVNVRRIREVFEDNDEVASWCDTSTYVGAETYTHLVGLYETALAAADEIDLLCAENKRLRALLNRIAEELSQAGIDDCESGVKWLNERAAENYLKEYRHTKAAIGTVIDLARAALKENSDE